MPRREIQVTSRNTKRASGSSSVAASSFSRPLAQAAQRELGNHGAFKVGPVYLDAALPQREHVG
jgi:hypothetical protein